MHKSSHRCSLKDRTLIVLFASLLLALLISNHSSYGKESDPILIKIEPTDDINGVFEAKKPLTLDVHLENTEEKEFETLLTCSLTTDEDTFVHSISEKHHLQSKRKFTRKFKFNVNEPGFYKVIVKCSWEEGSTNQVMQIGYDPESVRPPLTKESDFESFWKESLTALKQVDPQFELIHSPEKSTPSLTVYEVKMRSFGGTRIRGWYEVPNKEGPFPAALRLPGYGQNMKPVGIFKDIALLSLNPRGHGNSQEDIKAEPKNYWIRGLDDKELYYYRGAYMDCVRGIDFLCSRKEINKKKIAVFGGSQGGGLSFATASLDQRVSLCAPVVPFLAHWKKYFKTSDWPEMNEWVESKKERTWEKTLETLSYFDSMNLATRIQCPVFMGVGLQDPVCPPATNFAALNHTKGPKKYQVYANANHSLGPTHQERVRDWIRENFKP